MARRRTQYRIVPYREKRKDRRVLIPPVLVALETGTYETTNWSFGGFLLEGCAERRRYGDPIAGALGCEARLFPFAGRVTRCVAELGELGVAFEEIGEDAIIFLDAHLRDYIARVRVKG
jgi:hypothetical protein